MPFVFDEDALAARLASELPARGYTAEMLRAAQKDRVLFHRAARRAMDTEPRIFQSDLATRSESFTSLDRDRHHSRGDLRDLPAQVGRLRDASGRAREAVSATAGLSQDGRRRRSPLAATASQERRRGTPQELLGLPRWPPSMGTAAAGRRTDGGRWPETTRGVIRHSPQLGGCDLANKARRAFVLMGRSFAFARQSGVCGSGCRTNGARSDKRQRANLRPSLFWNACVGWSPTAPASRLIIPGVLSLRAIRLLDRTKLSRRDCGRDRREGSAAAPNCNRYSREARNYRINEA